MSDQLKFQYCQKIVLLNDAKDAVLLARRKGEADYDGVYSFIGGKMETTDGGFVEGLRREKNEEVGSDVQISISPMTTWNAYFVKKSGDSMVLPHYVAIYRGGEIRLNDEYADYKWVKLDQLESFEPKIDTIESAVHWAIAQAQHLAPADFLTI